MKILNETDFSLFILEGSPPSMIATVLGNAAFDPVFRTLVVENAVSFSA